MKKSEAVKNSIKAQKTERIRIIFRKGSYI